MTLFSYAGAPSQSYPTLIHKGAKRVLKMLNWPTSGIFWHCIFVPWQYGHTVWRTLSIPLSFRLHLQPAGVVRAAPSKWRRCLHSFDNRLLPYKFLKRYPQFYYENVRLIDKWRSAQQKWEQSPTLYAFTFCNISRICHLSISSSWWPNHMTTMTSGLKGVTQGSCRHGQTRQNRYMKCQSRAIISGTIHQESMIMLCTTYA